MSVKRDIGELLVENGQITEEELKRALEQVEKITEPTGSTLLRLGLVSEDNLKTVLELHYGVNYVELKKIAPNKSVVSLLPQKWVLQYDVVPVQRTGNRLTLAMVTPSDNDALDKIKEHLKEWQLNIVVCSDDAFQNFVSRAYPQSQSIQETNAVQETGSVQEKDTPQEMASAKETETESEFIELDDDVDLDPMLPEEQLVQTVGENKAMTLLSHHIISNAINKGCTNIHIEPNERQVLVHYRKEGVLFAARKLPKSLLSELVQRFKIMAAKAAGEVVLPYDGVLNVRHKQADFSFRLSIVPGAFGEHLIIWLE